MAKRALATAGAVTILIGAGVYFALPATPNAQNAGDRYVVTPIEGGIMRTDRYTGEMSVCRERGGTWRCEAVPEDRSARRRGGGDNFDGPGWREAPRRRGQRDEPYDDLGEGGIMSPEEVDQAMDTVEHMMKRFMETARKIQKDMRQPEPAPTR